MLYYESARDHKEDVWLYLASFDYRFSVLDFTSLEGIDHSLLSLLVHTSHEFIKVLIVLLVVLDVLHVGAIAVGQGYSLVKVNLMNVPEHSLEGLPSDHLLDLGQLQFKVKL